LVSPFFLSDESSTPAADARKDQSIRLPMADINRSNTSTTTMNIPYMSNSQRTTWEIKNFRPGVSKALEPWSLIDIDTTTDTMMDKGHISDAQLILCVLWKEIRTAIRSVGKKLLPIMPIPI
jgi:hypothetical protein